MAERLTIHVPQARLFCYLKSQAPYPAGGLGDVLPLCACPKAYLSVQIDKQTPLLPSSLAAPGVGLEELDTWAFCGQGLSLKLMCNFVRSFQSAVL